MKKIALAAFSATAMLALSACGDAAEEAPVEETTVIETQPMVDDTAMDAVADDAAAAAAGADAAADSAEDAADSAADAADAAVAE